MEHLGTNAEGDGSRAPFLPQKLEEGRASHLDGGTGEAGKLFDVLSLLADDGAHCLSGDEHLHHLLLWSLLPRQVCYQRACPKPLQDKEVWQPAADLDYTSPALPVPGRNKAKKLDSTGCHPGANVLKGGCRGLGALKGHPQPSLPFPCKFPSIRLPQEVGCKRRHCRAGSTVGRPCTYHKGAVGSSSSDAAGRWRNCTR